ncbi:MAG: plasmid encoded RepA protein [Treponema sp.]|nr:plasmid encoded RepA protein [Treponema sp.]
MKKETNEENQELFEKVNQLIDFEEQPKDVQKYRAYIPAPFIAAALPARDVKKNVFIRKYNNITLRLSSGTKVPFGKYGRLLLTILTTHAVINKNSNPDTPVVITYKSLNQLMKELQLPTSRCNEIKEQLECFANASFNFEERVQKLTQISLFKDLMEEGVSSTFDSEVKATKVSTGVIPFIKSMQYVELEDRKGEKQNVAFTIVLSDDFANFSKKHSVPIDYTAYKNITSAIGKDLYAWLVYRNNSLKEPLYISRESLVNQFMPVDENSNKDQFRTNWSYLKEQIKIIQEKHYKDLKINFDSDNLGFTLYKSKPPIVTNDQRYILVTSDL